MRTTIFQDAEVARRFLEELRAGIPYGADQLTIMLQLIDRFRPRPRRVMDIGCGDGILARTILESYPEARALLVDHSEPMIDAARARMAPYAGRCDVVLADMGASIVPLAAPESMDAVVSGFAIHHLPHGDKRRLYEEIHELLAPGGVFVNIEHVSSPSAELEALWKELFDAQVARAAGKTPEQAEEEKEAGRERTDNILASVEAQVEWLREIGFAHADCYFKWLELAVFGGVKREAG